MLDLIGTHLCSWPCAFPDCLEGSWAVDRTGINLGREETFIPVADLLFPSFLSSLLPSLE